MSVTVRIFAHKGPDRPASREPAGQTDMVAHLDQPYLAREKLTVTDVRCRQLVGSHGAGQDARPVRAGTRRRARALRGLYELRATSAGRRHN